ncbi:uncharacterized protein DUF3231 [Scopulibacillus darangshiensis]|uniref:Uncharacterized protein DUF3231 n=1 Tax=Scopulibacillus darangshiensis TaxID=442528 RepID=A0A4R2NEY0_9BACL|nr:DUF3231 family protein [Scopulibacillus darangshiensis]TCP19708.1 uncharacterized protein DUF3231 [Scopulibacillus darangshiensis]
MEQIHNAKLTAAEIAEIWSTYLNDSMLYCVLQHFFKTVKDPEIASVIQQGMAMSEAHLPQLKVFFNSENWPVAKGFTEADVNLDAPRLFSDTFMLYYMQQAGTLGMNAYSMAIAASVRPDIYGFFSTCMTETMDLHKKASDLLLEKGLMIRSPYLDPPKGIDFVTNQNFLGGWFGENRPLAALEILNLHANVQRNSLGKSLMMAFSQAAGTEKIRKFMTQGKEIAAKHVEVFSSKLNQGDLPASVTWDTEVTDSTVSPFSDKLMMYHTTGLIALSMAYYGAAMSTSLRKDITTDYTRLTAEIAKYSLEGAKITIDNGWLEEPPKALDRDQLAKSKE